MERLIKVTKLSLLISLILIVGVSQAMAQAPSAASGSGAVPGGAAAGGSPAGSPLSREGVVLRQAKIVSMKGTVEVKIDPTRNWEPASIGQILYKEAIIRTGKNGKVELILSGKEEREESAKVKLAPNSELAISYLETRQLTGGEKTRLDLAIGRVMIKARELKGDSEFEVKTPTSIAGVWGTEFEVSVTKEEHM